CSLLFFSSCLRLPPSSTLFPYTTLFRSLLGEGIGRGGGCRGGFCRGSCCRGVREPGASRGWPARDARGSGSAVLGLDGYDADKTDRKSTRLNSSHVAISYAVFCLKKKKN